MTARFPPYITRTNRRQDEPSTAIGPERWHRTEAEAVDRQGSEAAAAAQAPDEEEAASGDGDEVDSEVEGEVVKQMEDLQ